MPDDKSRGSARLEVAPGAGLAALAALLFGLSTPAARWLLGSVPPVLLSALLYLGSGVGLALVRLVKRRAPAGAAAPTRVQLDAQEFALLAGAIALGGVLAPVCLLAGLQSTSATSASLLLNLEGVFTALVAWTVFRESVDRALLLGMGCVLVAGALLSWPDSGTAAMAPPAPAGQALLPGVPGPPLIALACLAWALDNNLTRGIAHLDARAIAMWKVLIAGTVNLALALALGATLPAVVALPAALAVGFLGYGVSLVAYVRAQSLLGTARTSAWFGLAPFIGALAALVVLREAPPRFLLPAAALMAVGLWLHLRERHGHWHQHQGQLHSHAHRHDAHHQHQHDFPWDGSEPHSHTHVHAVLAHSHLHFPDLHHRHDHETGRTPGQRRRGRLTPRAGT